MATRFGGSNPAHTFATRVRVLVLILVGVILVLVGAIVFLAQSGDSEQIASDGSHLASATVPQVAPTVDILIALQRIEEGSQIMDTMLGVQSVHPDRIPEGAILSTEKTLVVGQYAAVLVKPNLPVMREDITDRKPISALNIPAGFRAVSIIVDNRTSVEGWAKPNTRVDVLWTYTDKDGTTKVATIVRFTKILSVGGSTAIENPAGAQAQGGSNTVTLLVSERDAKKIELARKLGVITLSLVGSAEPPKRADSPDVIDIYDILGDDREEGVEAPAEGVMYSLDPKTGKRSRFVLRKGRWTRED